MTMRSYAITWLDYCCHGPVLREADVVAGSDRSRIEHACGSSMRFLDADQERHRLAGRRRCDDRRTAPSTSSGGSRSCRRPPSAAPGSCACRGCRTAAGSGSASTSASRRCRRCVMVKVPPCSSSSVSLPSRARLPKSAMGFSISAKRHLVGVAHHRDDQALAGADGDADVIVVLVDRCRRRGSRR